MKLRCFCSCFRTIGQGYVWDELIFPGMSESIYAVLEATVDTSYYRDKTFQLFGADFVITDNYVPYLIEINSMPGLNPSTSVIANLVPMLLADIVKGTCFNTVETTDYRWTKRFIPRSPENEKVKYGCHWLFNGL